MKLYFASRTPASRARWLLEELEVPYELVRLDLSKQENRTPEYLAISPLGHVPALVDEACTLFETSAICLYLGDMFLERRLAPLPGSSDRGDYLQWLLFAEVTLQPAVMRLYAHSQLPDAEKSDPAAQDEHAKHREQLDAILDVIDIRVAGGDFLAADMFTVADLVTASILHLANHLDLLDTRPRLVKYVYLHCRRPACARAAA